MRQQFSQVFDLALGVAVAFLLVGAAGGAREPDEATAGRSVTAIPLANAYGAEIVDAPPLLAEPIDPKAAYLTDLVMNGRHWRLDTEHGPVHVWAPPGYLAETAQTVIYVHGYWADADSAWIDHRLPEQFALAGINALFVVPEAPSGKSDAICWPSPSALLKTVASALDEPLPKGRVAVVGHSGAYRTVIQWLADPRVDTVVLLDAAYVDVFPYRSWVVASQQRRFLDVSIDTIRWADRLHRTLPSTLTIDGFPGEITDQLREARILYIRSDIGHWQLVTEGVALPAMLRALGAPSALVGDEPPLGLPGLVAGL